MPDLGSSADKTMNILTSYVKGSKLKTHKNPTRNQSKKNPHDENIFKIPATFKVSIKNMCAKHKVMGLSNYQKLDLTANFNYVH